MTLPKGLLESLDDLCRSDLQDNRHCFWIWLLISTAVVALGVMLEGPELLRAAKEEINRFRFKHNAKVIFNPLTGLPIVARHLRWGMLLEVAGWLLIGVGVVGEFGFEIGVSNYDALIQSFDSAIIAEARIEAVEAEQKAADANDRAAKNEREAADARLETARLYALTAPRRLTLDAQQKLGMACRKFAGQTVTLSSYGTDPEARA